MKIKSSVKYLGFFAGIIGIIQGLTWTILALLVVLIYTKLWTPATADQSHTQKLNRIFVLLLTDNSTNGLLMGPLNFLICSIIYLIISLIWVGLSSYLISSLNSKKHNLIKNYFLLWALWTILICIYDVTLMGLFSSDYNYLSKLSSTMITSTDLSYYLLAFAILISLAAKGFILLINNVTAAIFMIKISMEYSKTILKENFTPDPIDGFRESKKPDLGNVNHGFNWQDEKTRFPQSGSFTSPSPQLNNQFQSYPKLYPKPNRNDHLAKIGRQGVRTPPLNVNPPKLPQTYIYPTQPRMPSPDYSPPNSPLQTPLKSVLKNRPTQNPFVFQNRY